MKELDDKVTRMARLAEAHGVAGVLVTLQPNFAWLSAGRSNRIDGSTESGAGGLFVTVSGAKYVVANTIEMPRLRDEALGGLGFEPIEYRWSRDHEDPAAAADAVRTAIGATRVGADIATSGITNVADAVTAAQTPLTDTEIDRYRSLGRDVGSAVGALCRSLQVQLTEIQVARRVNDSMAAVGARAVVTLVGADDRIARFRHPVPTLRRWTHSLLIGVCAERDGLVVALSRIIAAGTTSARIADRTVAAATVFGRLLGATRPGATGAELFEVARASYHDVGHAGEELLHHQGGAIGYRSRDWIAHPTSRATVQTRQAFAWNPSITGTKVEDTVLMLDGKLECITSSPDWPSIEVAAGAQTVLAPGILEV
jgi:Xaa-Pro aminopeptidase